MAIEKDNFGFRVDSWNSKIAATGQETFERLTNGEMAALVGCTEGSASNYRKTVAEATGWTMVAGKRSTGDTATIKANATAQPATVKQPAVKATGEFVGPPIERFLPGRIELLLEMLGHDIHLTGVIAAIEENSVPWCTQVRKMGEDERELMRTFTGMTAWTIADIDHEKREAKRLRPFKASAETVAKFAGIDAGLIQRETRFESSRYDVDLVTFYLAD